MDDTVQVVHSLPQERPQQGTVNPEQIAAEETTLNIANKEIPHERLPERIEEQIAGIFVPSIVEETAEVLSSSIVDAIEHVSPEPGVPCTTTFSAFDTFPHE